MTSFSTEERTAELYAVYDLWRIKYNGIRQAPPWPAGHGRSFDIEKQEHIFRRPVIMMPGNGVMVRESQTAPGSKREVKAKE